MAGPAAGDRGRGARDAGFEDQGSGTEQSPAWDDMVLVGRIARPHGIRGHVFVNAETDFVEERFAPGSTLWVAPGREGRSLTVASLRVQGGRPVLSFEGLTRIEDVEGLAGCELRVPESMLAPLDEGRFYHHQLVGCVVETTAGVPVGVVTRIDGGAGGSLLAVAGTRGEILVPLAADICVAIDIVAKRIRIEPPAGLLELNEKREAGPRGTRSRVNARSDSVGPAR